MGSRFILSPIRQAWAYEEPQPSPAPRVSLQASRLLTRFPSAAPSIRRVVKPPPVKVVEEEQFEELDFELDYEFADMQSRIQKFKNETLESDAERLIFSGMYLQHEKTTGQYTKIIRELQAENLALKQQIREITEVLQKDLECPISHEVFRDPVMLRDGHTYERKSIEDWFDRKNNTSPMTRQVLRRPRAYLPNIIVKKMVNALKLE